MASKTAVVTGGTRGLGRAVSLELAGAGYRVVALYRADSAQAASLAGEWSRRGQTGTCIQGDLANEVPKLPLDPDASEIVLVHNAAAPFRPCPLHLVSAADLEAQWAVAARAFLLCVQATIRAMTRAQRGTIVTVGTIALSGAPPKGFSAYVAAKAALESLSRSVAAEYADRGIRVFSVWPGYMETSLTAAWDPALKGAVAKGGVSDPDSVAKFIVRLVEDDNLPARGESYPSS
jgi:3-oxoacyl-[acyl-carrier protein] reductase